ncbi:MAG: InlB B-repeat-containing protein, partial [Clostridia bacterium]|nr:InlB B-repeat-containing protein [Clostridia bacterium]
SDLNWQRLSGNVFTMPAYNIWAQALYSINITASGDEHGTVALSHAGPYYEGDTVTLTTTPDSGYRVKMISGIPPDTVFSNNTITFTLGDWPDLDITVAFEEIPTTTAHFSSSPEGSGTVNASLDNSTKVITATATPNDGYHFLCWLDLDANAVLSRDNPYSFTLTAERNIAAIFYVIVAVNSNVEHGSLEVVNPKQTYAAGDTVTLLGHPDDGYVVDYYMAWEYHNGSVTPQRLEGNSFVMPPWDVWVSVEFVPGYTVSTAVSSEGSGTVVGAGKYKPDSTATLVAEPAEGYTFTGWEENGTVVSTERIYSFTINADAVPAAGGTITGTGTYAAGEAVTLTASPAPGYSFLGWSECGQTIATNAVYSFAANGNRTLTATFLAGVTYVNTTGNELLCEIFTPISSATTAMNTGWYAVAGNVTIPSRIEISGAVNLILRDGASLTVPNGIHLTGANSLTIWGQNAGTGTLTIDSPGVNLAGIGGNELQPGGIFTMNGGTLTVTGGKGGAGIGGGGDSHATVESVSHAGLHTRGWAGTITINGGTVAATGGECGAGIGCGLRGDGGTITITGGTVTATGGTNSAGIGGAESSFSFHQSIEEIHITGGTITVTGAQNGAGIGGGAWGRVGTIIIDGGTVTAFGGQEGAGIGCGYFGMGGQIILNGGTVTATGGKKGAGIGGGRCVYGSVTVAGGTITAIGGESAAGIGGGYNAGTLKYSGGTVTISGGTV